MNAINPKYQKQVEQAIKLMAKYNDLDNQRNRADGLGDDKLVRKLDKQCETVFNKYIEIEEELPSREVKVINDYVYGEPRFSVWVGGVEVNDYYLTLRKAIELKDMYRDYDDVCVCDDSNQIL